MKSGGDIPGNRRAGDGGQLPRAPMAVLFVDPDVASAQRLALALANSSSVAIVPSAYAAIAAIQSRAPNLLVTELDLPDASGLELLARVHATPAMRHMLLMVVTARTSVQDKIAAFQAGADDILVKPVQPEQFALRVEMLSRFRRVIGN